MMNN
jgi:hypothetical protein